jgi:multidrug resistance protein MdtO
VASILSTWIGRFQQDLEPLPGRMNASLRIVLASVITLLFIMTLRMPFSGIGMYFVFLVGRDSPAVSFRSSFLTLLTLAAAVGAVLIVVIISDNDPVVRLLSVAVITFIGGMILVASTVPVLGGSFGLIYCILIALWETPTGATPLVKEMLYLLGTIALAVGSVVAVEYTFATRHPAEDLLKERLTRYGALERMFRKYASGASADEMNPLIVGVSRLAATGQSGMQRLYNTIVERKIDPGRLPIGTRVRITMLAQLMDISAAFGWQNPTIQDPALQERCTHIANLCGYLAGGNISPERNVELMRERLIREDPSLIDRIDGVLHSILTMPMNADTTAEKRLVALPSSSVPFLVPGALKRRESIGFALKISLCATICYIVYHAVAWPGISTAVTTVMITGLSTTGATKQRLVFRLAGSVIGGLILGLGATVFLLPFMDSITSLVVLVTAVAFFSAWVSGGRQFSYVGLQIAFSFYLVVLAGFSAPTELAPARDRLIGILLALVVMAFVFDQIWPLRTVTVMRSSLATIIRGEASFLRLPQTARDHDDLVHQSDALRDQLGKVVAAIRSMNDTIDYEFGVDRKLHTYTGQTILRAAMVAVASFWNQFAVLHSKDDHDFFTEPDLSHMRTVMAEGMDMMAESVTKKSSCPPLKAEGLVTPELLAAHPRYRDYVQNAIARYDELQNLVAQLQHLP